MAAVLVLVSDPFGSNILRLGLLLAAPLVVATASEHWRLVAPVTAVLVLWQLQPSYYDLREARPPSFVALNRALIELEVKRIEVVPLRDHGVDVVALHRQRAGRRSSGPGAGHRPHDRTAALRPGRRRRAEGAVVALVVGQWAGVPGATGRRYAHPLLGPGGSRGQQLAQAASGGAVLIGVRVRNTAILSTAALGTKARPTKLAGRV